MLGSHFSQIVPEHTENNVLEKKGESDQENLKIFKEVKLK